MLWPDHCVIGTKGSALNPKLPLECATLLLRKGMRKDCDSYSVFFENDGMKTGLSSFLKERGINYKDVISSKLLPDEALYVPNKKTMYIIEKKFQKTY